VSRRPEQTAYKASAALAETRECRMVCLSTKSTPGHQIFRPTFSRD
jgi:hypothetical protein